MFCAVQAFKLPYTDKIDSTYGSVGEQRNIQKTNVTIACSINDVTSSVCPIPTIIAGFSPFAFILKSISLCLCEVCTINSTVYN